MPLDREQLDALRRQIEEDYKLDMAAIERLNRRFMAAGGAVAAKLATRGAAAEATEDILPRPDPTPIPQGDELTSSLRAMFSHQRK